MADPISHDRAQHFVEALYQCLLRRSTIGENELRYWSDYLLAGQDAISVFYLFLNSDEFRSINKGQSDTVPERLTLKWMKFELTKLVVRFVLDSLVSRCSNDVFFVQVGANDGVTEDQIYPYARSLGWAGIAIEPAEHPFKRLVRSYEGQPQVRCLQTACGRAAEDRRFYQVKPESHKNSGLSSFHLETIRPAFNDEGQFRRDVDIFEIPTVRLDSILIAEEKCDLLAIDTEGDDFNVLLGFDFSRLHPWVVIVEHYHLSDIDSSAMSALMHRAGYDRCAGAMDTLFIRRGLLDFKASEALSALAQGSLKWDWEDNH